MKNGVLQDYEKAAAILSEWLWLQLGTAAGGGEQLFFCRQRYHAEARFLHIRKAWIDSTMVIVISLLGRESVLPISETPPLANKNKSSGEKNIVDS